MDSGDSKDDGSTMRRRSTRHASKTALYSADAISTPSSKKKREMREDDGASRAVNGPRKYKSHENGDDDALYSADLKPRPPIKRTWKMREDDGASRAVNGSKESKNHEKGDDDEIRAKIQKRGETEKASDTNERGDGFKHTDVEMRDDEVQDQDMSSDEKDEQDYEPSLKVDSSAQSGTVEKHPPLPGQENLKSEEILANQMSICQTTVNAETPGSITQTENYRPNTMSRDPSSLGVVLLTNNQEPIRMRNKNTPKYQIPITEKDKNDPCPRSWSRCPSKPQMIKVYPTIKQSITHQTTHHKNTELKNLQKPVISKASPVSSSRGWLWYMCKILLWFLILTGLLALGFLVYRMFLCSPFPQTDVSHSEIMEKFDLDLAALQDHFRSQRPVFWKRSGKHLKRHLDMVNPTEPVSVILTAGLNAEKTLGCLARGLATAYSAFLNASILEIDGTTERAKDSDQVKLEIDEALKEAFEGDKPAAVVHRFEELPPGSTLIFYRYCDHENAAYKKVFLVFTVMLSVDEIDTNASLSAVEDMVHDHIKQKFVSSDISAKFNQMDVDKLSGLWSRISHVILPVAPEEKIEQQGCRD